MPYLMKKQNLSLANVWFLLPRPTPRLTYSPLPHDPHLNTIPCWKLCKMTDVMIPEEGIDAKLDGH